jgi:hypothetical protein
VRFLAEINQRWGQCITELLDRHGLSTRAAEMKSNRAATSTYIGSMKKGTVPSYQVAVAFLGVFPKDEAVKCLEIAGYPVPQEWLQEMEDQLEALDIFLRRGSNFSPEEIEEVKASYQRVKQRRQDQKNK